MIEIQELRERLKSPTKAGTIAEAIEYENRIRFHCQSTLKRSTCSPYINDYEKLASTRLSADKWPIFKANISFPIITVEQTAKIRETLQKVNDAQNPVYKAEFKSKNYEADWTLARAKIEQDWKDQAEEVYWTAPNSIVVIDLPREQKTKYPEPYFYFVNICHAIEWDNVGKNLLWVALRQGKDRILVIDDYSYRLFDATTGIDTMTLEFESLPHNLGMCPANWLVKDSISDKQPDVKKHVLTDYLGKLDDLHFYLTSQLQGDQSVPWPITAVFEEECDFKTETRGGYQQCHQGYMQDDKGHNIMLQSGQPAQCPICRERKHAGPGTIYDIPLPKGDNQPNLMANDIIKVVPAEVAGSIYYDGRVKSIQKEIYEGVTGYGGEPTNNQAQNEKQVLSMFEGKKAALMRFKEWIECIKSWRDTVICTLKYGQNFVSVMVSEGTEWFFLDAGTLLDIYNKGVIGDWDMQLLSKLYDMYIHTEYKNNPQQLKREMIINNIDPLKHVSLPRATALFQTGRIDEISYLIKLNLYTFVLKFEREQAPLVEYGSMLNESNKINVITQILKSYGESIRGQQPTTTPVGA